MTEAYLQKQPRPLKALLWGTYDLGKPRVRILIRGLRENGVEVEEIHRDVWMGVEDKSQLSGFKQKIRILFRWASSYPWLIWRYLRAPSHDVVVVGYLGIIDILILWSFVKLRKKAVVLDAFLSIYNTVVEDRKLLSSINPIARLLWFVEWLGCHAADRLITDTNAHGEYFISTYHLKPEKLGRILVGAEPEVFSGKPMTNNSLKVNNRTRILFYGQFIPLHGIETIVEAAADSSEEFEWHLIGRGQESEKIRALIKKLRPTNLIWHDWVPYDDLIEHIQSADICLGIFGTTEKAARVIPNKVFQILQAEKPLITADTPAIRELLTPSDGLVLIPAGDAKALKSAVLSMAGYLKNHSKQKLKLPYRVGFSPADIGAALLKEFQAVVPNSLNVTKQ